MDYFGLNSAEDLPKIREVLADQVVEPTPVRLEHVEGSSENFTAETSDITVGENGELIQNQDEESREES